MSLFWKDKPRKVETMAQVNYGGISSGGDSNSAKAASALKVEAANLIPKVIAEQDDRLAVFVASHKKDLAGYSFSCKRHGDHMAVFITRGAAKVVAAIPICAGAIHFVPGKAPAKDQTAHFGVTTDWTDARRKERAAPRYGRANSMGATFSEKPDDGRGYYDPFGSYYPSDNAERELWQIIVPGCAADAVDDRITFGPTGTTIYAPAGAGEAVYQKLLAAIGKRRAA